MVLLTTKSKLEHSWPCSQGLDSPKFTINMNSHSMHLLVFWKTWSNEVGHCHKVVTTFPTFANLYSIFHLEWKLPKEHFAGSWRNPINCNVYLDMHAVSIGITCFYVTCELNLYRTIGKFNKIQKMKCLFSSCSYCM